MTAWGPIQLKWEVTRKCNLHCIHCVVAADSNQKQEVPPDRIQDCIDRISELRPLRVLISGGEPLLYQGLFEVVQGLTDNGIEVNLETNGITVNRSIAIRLRRKGCKHVRVSLHGRSSLTHDALVARNGAWKHAIKTVKLLVNEGIDTSISFALARFNIGEFPKVLKLAESLGVNSVFVNNLVPIGRAYQNWDHLSPTMSQLARFRRFIGNEHCRYLRSKRRLVLDFDVIKSLRSFVGCCVCACVISPAGEVRIADVFPIVVGNLLKEEPMAIWKRINQTWADPFIAEFIRKELRNILDLHKIKDLQDHYKVAQYALV